MDYDVIIIGAGPAGMSAAIEIKKQDKNMKILLLEREEQFGGTLNQCIHFGFIDNDNEIVMTGSEYSQKFVDLVHELDIDFRLETTVFSITKEKVISYVNPKEGVIEVSAKAIIIATGIRELFSGNISIPLNKFAGVYTVGVAHKFINNQGYLPGKNIVILGSSDSTLLVARRLIVEGANIRAIIESNTDLRAKEESSRKIVEDFNIPVMFGYRVSEVMGNERIEELLVSKIEDHNEEQLAVLENIECDSLLISVNYLPDKKLGDMIGLNVNEDLGIEIDENFNTNVEGIFAAGGVVKGYCRAHRCAKQGKEVGEIVVKYCNEI